MSAALVTLIGNQNSIIWGQTLFSLGFHANRG